MKVGSLFSGIGGIDLGLERAGMEVRWQVENDPYCQDVLRKHWPNVTLYGDITTVDWGTVEPVDLLCGGFPCQPVSVAGRRKGQEDSRWLWPCFSAAIGYLRPQWVLVENVPGLRSANGGQAFAEVLSDLARYGYDAEWAGIPAAAVGAPHLRYRVFIVAYAASLQRARQPGGVVEGGPRRTRPRDGGEDVADAQGSSAGGLPLGAQESILGVNGQAGYPPEPGLPDRADLQILRSGQEQELKRSDWWAVEPDVGRVAHGVPRRVDRLRSLGNAVVPQVAEWVGRQILEASVRAS